MTKFYLGNTKASKLSPDKVFEIRSRWADRFFRPVTQAQMSVEYGVSPNTISNIVHGRTHQAVGMVESAADAAYLQQLANSRLKEKLEQPGSVDPVIEKELSELQVEKEKKRPNDALEFARSIRAMAEGIRRRQQQETSNDDSHSKDQGEPSGSDAAAGSIHDRDPGSSPEDGDGTASTSSIPPGHPHEPNPSDEG